MQFKKQSTGTIQLVVITVIVFLLQLAIDSATGSPFNGWFTNTFLLDSSKVLLEPWRLFTSIFLHGGVSHLFFNMFALIMFGPIIESRLGKRNFILFYLVAGVLASLIAFSFYPRALGASGAVYGVLGLIIILVRGIKVMPLFIPIPMELWKAVIVFTLLDVFIFSNVAVAAHLGGLAVGLLYGLYLLRKRKEFQQTFVHKKPKPSEVVIDMDERDIDNYFKNGRI
jgi:membrane associated rhomboid family serine protease